MTKLDAQFEMLMESFPLEDETKTLLRTAFNKMPEQEQAKYLNDTHKALNEFIESSAQIKPTR